MGDPGFESRQGNKYSLWRTSSVRPSDIHTSQPTICTVFVYLLHRTVTCFGHISWPFSGSYTFGQYVKYSLYGNLVRPKHVAVPYNKYKNITQTIGSQIWVNVLFLKTIQTSSGAQHSPPFNGYRGSFPEVRRPGSNVYHSDPSIDVKNEWGKSSSPTLRFHCANRDKFTFLRYSYPCF
jgi:hypothetical protein